MEEQQSSADRVRQLLRGQHGPPPGSPWEVQGGLGDRARLDSRWPPANQVTIGDEDDLTNDEGLDEHGDEGEITGDEGAEEGAVEDDEELPFDPTSVGLKEISNLASFTVSSYKPGCGVNELRDDNIHLFWQSDGPQPHRLNIHFIKRVEIRALRLYLDYELDESYTPTKIQITAGFGPNLTIPFTTMELSMPKGWLDVPIAGAGGGPDGNSLCCWFVRIIILENHQNGKDTHLRGVKVYGLDDNADTAENNPVEDIVEVIDDYEDRLTRMNINDHDERALLKHEADVQRKKAAAKKFAPGEGGLSIPDFMREPEIR
ncbi:anaphase-promoting complex, subunit 10-domain-containing protein [Truncatella angustata]|uniref:Anaphase-promoting complex, subunit 10-domain-containing protein n=1 Tax=Truncatella angustata TaxID=152316 RepID=A0A9P9A157_9PEZI|nr:anaphase-promoting complex, subunit 10-domain-containing protein [Truncatella angustata]KAH6656690.1 anaphase-promoting complex, subunit 10-domain-containing protein [Truncatella angustata]